MYNFKNTNSGKYKTIKNPVARGKAGMFCRQKEKAFKNLNLRGQPMNVVEQWEKVKQAVDEDCERIIKFTNGNTSYENDFNLGYVLDIQNQIGQYARNLNKLKTPKNMKTKNSFSYATGMRMRKQTRKQK